MKRLQILIEEDLDADLERAAQRAGRSKGSLVREYVRKQLQPLPPIEQDPIWQLAGAFDLGPHASSEVDEIVYGRIRTSKRKKRAGP